MSARNRATRRADGVRYGLLAAAVVGVAALVVATFATVIRITVGTATRLANLDTSLSGWDRHGPALLVVAGFAVPMVVGAARGARPALFVALGLDAPHLDDTGQVGALYADASAGPGVGFWLEVVGGALLAVAGAGFLVVARRSGAALDRSGRTTHRGEGPTGAAAPLRAAPDA